MAKDKSPEATTARDRRRGFTDEDLKTAESPELTTEQLARMRSAIEVRPDLVARAKRTKN